jgi:hypothetical protein
MLSTGKSTYHLRRERTAQVYEQLQTERKAPKPTDAEAHPKHTSQGKVPQQPPTPLASRTPSLASDPMPQKGNNPNAIKDIGAESNKSAAKK